MTQAGTQPRIVNSEELKAMFGMAKEAKDDRAFGWPTGTVRAVLCGILLGGFVLGVIAGLIFAGIDGATTAGSILGPPAGSGTSFYFMNRLPKT